MTIYKIAKECIGSSAYQSEVSLQRAILNYINNCLSNFGCSIEDFKNKKDENSFIINNDLEAIIKSYALKGKRFPFVNHFEAWKNHPEWYQNKVDETIVVTKSFLDYNFNDGTYKRQREIIKKNMEEAELILQKANKANMQHQYNVSLNISNFKALITMSNEKLEEYYSMVWCAYKSLSYNEFPSFDVNERIVIEFIQYASNIQKFVDSINSQYILDYCTNKTF